MPRSDWSRDERLPFLTQTGSWAMCWVAGFLQALSLAWPLDGAHKGTSLASLQLLAMVVFCGVVLQSKHARDVFLKSVVFAWTWLIGSTWWLYISLHTYGGLAAIWASLAVAALSAGLALIYGAACALFHRLQASPRDPVTVALAFAAVWTLAEIVRGTLWTGFPWGAIGYAHVEGALRHWAPWFGVYGLCFIAAFFSMGVAAFMKMGFPKHPLPWLLLTSVLLGLGWTWLNAPSHEQQLETTGRVPLRVTLLQGNIPQDLKFGAGIGLALRDYRQALLASTSDLTVTPETALPLTTEQLPPGYWAEMEHHFSSGTGAALIGLVRATPQAQGQTHYSNAAIGLLPHRDAPSVAYQYDKHHLVPFGEFVPPLFQWFVRQLNIPLGEFTRGDVAQPTLQLRGERIAPNICYEDLFGEELARRFSDPTTAPTMMVNLSNIAWFGDTVAIDQHLNISRMRALEMARPMLRATNTGATAIINAQGVVTHRLPSATAGALTADVLGVDGPVTPYARWVSAYGLWPMVVVALFILALSGAMGHLTQPDGKRIAP